MKKEYKKRIKSIAAYLALLAITILLCSFTISYIIKNAVDEEQCYFEASGQDANTGNWYRVERMVSCDEIRFSNKLK